MNGAIFPETLRHATTAAIRPQSQRDFTRQLKQKSTTNADNEGQMSGHRASWVREYTEEGATDLFSRRRKLSQDMKCFKKALASGNIAAVKKALRIMGADHLAFARVKAYWRYCAWKDR